MFSVIFLMTQSRRWQQIPEKTITSIGFCIYICHKSKPKVKPTGISQVLGYGKISHAFHAFYPLSTFISICRQLMKYFLIQNDTPPRLLNFRYCFSPASKARYGWNTAKATKILNTTNQPSKASPAYGLMKSIRRPHSFNLYVSVLEFVLQTGHTIFCTVSWSFFLQKSLTNKEHLLCRFIGAWSFIGLLLSLLSGAVKECSVNMSTSKLIKVSKSRLESANYLISSKRSLGTPLIIDVHQSFIDAIRHTRPESSQDVTWLTKALPSLGFSAPLVLSSREEDSCIHDNKKFFTELEKLGLFNIEVRFCLLSLQIIATLSPLCICLSIPLSVNTSLLKLPCFQYGISQLTSHQHSRALADCFRLSWRHQNNWATLVTEATLHEVLSKFSSDLPIPASQANS